MEKIFQFLVYFLASIKCIMIIMLFNWLKRINIRKCHQPFFSTGNEIHDNLDAALTLLAMSLAMPEGAVLFLSADILYGAGNKQERICRNKSS